MHAKSVYITKKTEKYLLLLSFCPRKYMKMINLVYKINKIKYNILHHMFICRNKTYLLYF